ncbi:MAG: PASTA domain-containing protein, partial [Pseudomonadota bacterium]
ISQNPAGGSSVAPGTAVDLVVSSGPAPVNVPDVTGLSQSSASAALTGAGLVVGNVTNANSDTVPAGDVISQNPAGGSSVAPGTAVDLVVSSGPAGPQKGDADNDGDIDRNDLTLIGRARNQPASGPNDPRDFNSDGVINVLDVRQAAQACTLPRCAIVP